MNLIPVIKHLRSCIRDERRKADQEIAAINDRCAKRLAEYEVALHMNEDLNTACLACNGDGYTYEPTDSTYDCRSAERVLCPECKGTGLIRKEEP